jgi:hypothetical protein
LETLGLRERVHQIIAAGLGSIIMLIFQKLRDAPIDWTILMVLGVGGVIFYFLNQLNQWSNIRSAYSTLRALNPNAPPTIKFFTGKRISAYIITALLAILALSLHRGPSGIEWPWAREASLPSRPSPALLQPETPLTPRLPSTESAPAMPVPTHSTEPPLPQNAKFRYQGKVFWASPRRYTKDEASEMRAELREVYDCINTKSVPVVSSWDGSAVTFTRSWLSLIQREGRQSAIAKLNDIRSNLNSAHTELQAILNRRPYYRQDMMTIINDQGEVGHMNGALNDYLDALRKIGDNPTADLIQLAIGPSESRFETAVTKYTSWISAFNTKVLLLREELEALMND